MHLLRAERRFGHIPFCRTSQCACNTLGICLLATLCMASASSAQKDFDTDQKLRNYITDAGGAVDCVELTTARGIRGLRATCNIEAGRVLMFAPTSIMFSTKTTDQQVWEHIVPDEETLFLVKRGKDPAAAVVLLALVMLHEWSLGSRSVFAAYIASMPREPPDILALGDEIQMQVISSVLPDAATWRDQMLQGVSDHVMRNPVTFGNASGVQQRRAISYVLSRSRAYVSKHVTSHVLVPFQDLPNHDESPNCNEACDDAGCKFVASRDIVRGEEISHSYGAKSDLNLLYTYGFASGNNYSSLRISNFASEDAVVACGTSLKLHKASQLALDPEAAVCFENYEGRTRFLKAVFDACSDLMGHLVGNVKIYESLAALDARAPARALDGPLASAIRGELSTLQRCISESHEALKGAVSDLDVKSNGYGSGGDDLGTGTVRKVLDERTIEVRDLGKPGRKTRRLQLARISHLTRGSLSEEEYQDKLAAAKKSLESMISNEAISWRAVAVDDRTQMGTAPVVADVWKLIDGKHINEHLSNYIKSTLEGEFVQEL